MCSCRHPSGETLCAAKDHQPSRQTPGVKLDLAGLRRTSILHWLVGNRHVIHIHGRSFALFVVSANADLEAVIDSVREHQRLPVGIDQVPPILPEFDQFREELGGRVVRRAQPIEVSAFADGKVMTIKLWLKTIPRRRSMAAL